MASDHPPQKGRNFLIVMVLSNSIFILKREKKSCMDFKQRNLDFKEKIHPCDKSYTFSCSNDT